jgi:hypothetical protein
VTAVENLAEKPAQQNEHISSPPQPISRETLEAELEDSATRARDDKAAEALEAEPEQKVQTRDAHI